MPGQTQGSRLYSAPPSTHNVAINYGWADLGLITGSANTQTGAWIPIAVDSNGLLQTTLANATFSGQISIQSGSFVLTPQIITGSQVSIPQGVRSYAISVISGAAFVNGVGPIQAYTNIAGGGFDGNWVLGSPINVGGTGTVANPCNILVTYES